MSTTGLSVFDETLQLANIWLDELMQALDWDNKQRAYRMLRATLHALRDRLTPHEAVHLGAQLPMLIRGIYYEGWHMRDTAPAERTKAAFLGHVEAEFKHDPNEDIEAPVAEVLKLLGRKISSGEIEDVRNMLPEEVRALWPVLNG